MPTILIVDDSATDRRLAGGLLSQLDAMNIEYATDGGDALVKMELHVPDVVVTDLDMPHIRLMRRLVRQEIEFVIENDQELMSYMVQFLQDTALAMSVCDEAERVRIGVALQEALTNASFHGNLELCSSMREEDHRAYYQMALERMNSLPWSTRRIHVTARFTSDAAEFVIQDDGPGFNPRC